MRDLIARRLALALSALLLTATLAAQTRPRRVGTNQPSTPPAQTSRAEEVGEDDVVRINTTLVTIPVSVMDRDGKYIPDLRKEDFRIYENGVEQEIAYFAAVEQPFTVALLLDTSRSTRFRMDEIQDAAIAFVEQLRPADRVMVVSFDDSVRVLAEATNDRRTLRDAIMRARTGGGTKLYDAVDFVINRRFDKIQGRKAIVLFTDGVDTTSERASYGKHTARCRRSGCAHLPGAVRYAGRCRVAFPAPSVDHHRLAVPTSVACARRKRDEPRRLRTRHALSHRTCPPNRRAQIRRRFDQFAGARLCVDR